jgi:hypothetical protein
MRDYTVTIAESIKELTARERISLKSFDTATPLDKVTEDAPIRFTVENVVTCDVHNERAKKDQNKDYKTYIFVADDGTRYKTGSESLITAFFDIYDEMVKEAPDEPITIEVYKQASKNYEGKFFLTCALV